MGLRIRNVRLRGHDNKIVRVLHSMDGENWFEDPACTIPIDPRTARTAGTMDDVLFFIVLAVLIGVAAARFMPHKSQAQITREKIEALQRLRVLQDTMVDVYIQQLSRQTNE
jgi:hypothetical protein